VIAGGAQDNGVLRQDQPGKPKWSEIQGGDGAIVEVTRAPDRIFFSSQALGNFTVQSGATKEHPDLQILGARMGPRGRLDIKQFDETLQFIQPYAVNSEDPSRLLFGTELLYETPSTGQLAKVADEL